MGKDRARGTGPQSREDRLKAALKANLSRRKAQARARREELNENPDLAGADDDGQSGQE